MNILAFFAHPDDETMLCGGTLALLARAGAQVHYLCATRGEGGEVGIPPVSALEELGQAREQELVCAVEALGGRSLTFLDYVDPRVGPEDSLFAYATAEQLTFLAGQIAATIDQFEIEAVLTHGINGEYGHPAHILTHQAARIAVESMGARGPLLYAVSAAFPDHPRPVLTNEDNPAHLALDVSPAIEQKVQAALCHLSQHDLFVRRSSEDAGRTLSVPECVIAVEGLHRVLPPVSDEEADALSDGLADMLREYAIQRSA